MPPRATGRAHEAIRRFRDVTGDSANSLTYPGLAGIGASRVCHLIGSDPVSGRSV